MALSILPPLCDAMIDKAITLASEKMQSFPLIGGARFESS